VFFAESGCESQAVCQQGERGDLTSKLSSKIRLTATENCAFLNSRARTIVVTKNAVILVMPQLRVGPASALATAGGTDSSQRLPVSVPLPPVIAGGWRHRCLRTERTASTLGDPTLLSAPLTGLQCREVYGTARRILGSFVPLLILLTQACRAWSERIFR
jgi:hypothetical protein